MPLDENLLDLRELSEAWALKWPNCRPIAGEIRGVHERWVRFHCLPGSKRCANTDQEYEEILRRELALLTDLSRQSRVDSDDVLIVTYTWSDSRDVESAPRSDRGHHWMSLPVDPHENDVWAHLFASKSQWRSGELNSLLRRIADDEIRALIMPLDLQWLFAPYDGGVDIVVANSSLRDELKSAHFEWLPLNPSGL